MSYTWNKAKEDFYRGGVIFLSFAFFATITYAAISWPSTPSGEVDGGKYSAKLVPSGFVGAFKTATCPTGWKPADGTNGNPDLRGEFIRGLDSGRNVDTGRTLASAQGDMIKSHNHVSNVDADDLRISHSQDGSPQARSAPYERTTAYVGNFWWTETRPRNVALLYCVKD